MRIAVLGAGAWGTALAQVFSASHEVCLWGRETDNIETMRRERENKLFLSGIALRPELEFNSDFNQAAQGADLHLITTSLAGLRETTRALRNLQQTSPAAPLIWACKGFEAGSGKLPHEIIAEEMGKDAVCGVLTGPSFAADVAHGLPTAVTLASSNPGFATDWVYKLHQPKFRIYANDDVIGCETGGALKNVIAIATGVADGMGYGLNTRAAIITRGLAEIARLTNALGGRPETLMGLAGMGDLILTCTGDLSRNRQVGLALAMGKKLPDILAELGHVAEGVSTAREITQLSHRLGVDMPICTGVGALLHGGANAHDLVEQLLARDPKQEREHLES
ncbi:MAG: NAD(P)-dependent glycerol-3-phosphate dehydrogenase [Betaproteobacteria bacterium]|nr:NAD(P)-dependent glycerol-3-phosphate dehydrogenase [Betaproteobacteria bacterium]